MNVEHQRREMTVGASFYDAFLADCQVVVTEKGRHRMRPLQAVPCSYLVPTRRGSARNSR